MPKRHLRQVAKIANIRPFREGAAIVKEGVVDATFYLIVDGKAIAGKDFRQLLEREPRLVIPILQVMAKRLRGFLRSDL